MNDHENGPVETTGREDGPRTDAPDGTRRRLLQVGLAAGPAMLVFRNTPAGATTTGGACARSAQSYVSMQTDYQNGGVGVSAAQNDCYQQGASPGYWGQVLNGRGGGHRGIRRQVKGDMRSEFGIEDPLFHEIFGSPTSGNSYCKIAGILPSGTGCSGGGNAGTLEAKFIAAYLNARYQGQTDEVPQGYVFANGAEVVNFWGTWQNVFTSEADVLLFLDSTWGGSTPAWLNV